MLSLLEWPKATQESFLARWRRGDPALPEVPPLRVDLRQPQEALRAVLGELDPSDPLEGLLAVTARSYILACRMLEAAGTREFTRLCRKLYGRPGRTIPGSSVTSIDAARHFVEIADHFPKDLHIPEDHCRVPAEEMRSYLLRSIPEVITEDAIEVVIDDNLAAKAAAGSRRVRLRSDAVFSPYDGPQLLQHEVLIHSLTALNGKRQPVLKILGEGAPRTTAAQEGLATFAELVTGAIDLDRFKRIALRVLALQVALQGADFLEVFRFFLDHGQNEVESYQSTQRLFRGGDVRGNAIVFTKDGVYLEGLLTVYAFFQWCIRQRRLDLGALLFAGRMAIADVLVLDEARAQGVVAAPRYVPPWYTRTLSLVGYLAFADFAHTFDLHGLDCPDATGLFRRAPLTDSLENIPPGDLLDPDA